LGDWTYSLHTAIFNAAAKTSDPELACPFAVKLHVEGPYGHESNYYLRFTYSIIHHHKLSATEFGFRFFWV
jgi:ferric-chelate reductase